MFRIVYFNLYLYVSVQVELTATVFLLSLSLSLSLAKRTQTHINFECLPAFSLHFSRFALVFRNKTECAVVFRRFIFVSRVKQQNRAGKALLFVCGWLIGRKSIYFKLFSNTFTMSESTKL